MTLGDRIRSRREELRMSQEELATRLGYKSRSTIAKIESGENDLTQSKIVAFAEALSTTARWLLVMMIQTRHSLPALTTRNLKKCLCSAMRRQDSRLKISIKIRLTMT